MPDYVLGTRIHDKLFPLFYNFNAFGYLPLGLPRVVSFYRAHGDSLFAAAANVMHVSVQDYARRVRRHRADLIAGRRVHTYRDGKGQPLGELRWPEDVTADDLRVNDSEGRPIDGTKQLEAAFPRS